MVEHLGRTHGGCHRARRCARYRAFGVGYAGASALSGWHHDDVIVMEADAVASPQVTVTVPVPAVVLPPMFHVQEAFPAGSVCFAVNPAASLTEPRGVT